MKATLEFNLPAEESIYRNTIDGPRAFSLINELKRMIREKLKYGESTDKDILEQLRTEIYEEFPDIDDR